MAEREEYQTVTDAMRSICRNVTLGDSCLVLYPGERKAFKDVSALDLHHVHDGAIIYFTGAANIAASYFLQIVDTNDGRKARMWKHTHAAHLEISIDELASFHEERGTTVVERGVLKERRRFLMPYFEYDTIDGVKATKPPTTQWFDVYNIIRIMEPKQ